MVAMANLKSTIRIQDLPSGTVMDELLTFREKIMTEVEKAKRFRPRNKSENGQGLGKQHCSLDLSSDTKTATLSFPSEDGKEKALHDTSSGWAMDDTFHGLTILHSVENADVDICAIHGLNGHGYNTWTAAERMWLRDLLPVTEPFNKTRIMTFGYNSGLADHKVSSGIRHWASALLTQISRHRGSTKERQRPLILVCHSLGGLVAREALIRLGQLADQYDRISLSQCGALFLSTPHSGASAADWNGPLLTIAELAFGIRQQEIVDRLRPFNDSGVASKEAFASIRPQPPIYCLCEGNQTKVGGGYRQVVTQDSAGLNGITAEAVLGVDHSTICRFDRRDDGFWTVIDRLIKLRTELLSRRQEAESSQTQPHRPHEASLPAQNIPQIPCTTSGPHDTEPENDIPSSGERIERAIDPSVSPLAAPTVSASEGSRPLIFQGGSQYGPISGKVVSGTFSIQQGNMYF